MDLLMEVSDNPSEKDDIILLQAYTLAADKANLKCDIYLEMMELDDRASILKSLSDGYYMEAAKSNAKKEGVTKKAVNLIKEAWKKIKELINRVIDAITGRNRGHLSQPKIVAKDAVGIYNDIRDLIGKIKKFISKHKATIGLIAGIATAAAVVVKKCLKIKKTNDIIKKELKAMQSKENSTVDAANEIIAKKNSEVEKANSKVKESEDKIRKLTEELKEANRRKDLADAVSSSVSDANRKNVQNAKDKIQRLEEELEKEKKIAETWKASAKKHRKGDIENGKRADRFQESSRWNSERYLKVADKYGNLTVAYRDLRNKCECLLIQPHEVVKLSEEGKTAAKELNAVIDGLSAVEADSMLDRKYNNAIDDEEAGKIKALRKKLGSGNETRPTGNSKDAFNDLRSSVTSIITFIGEQDAYYHNMGINLHQQDD